MAGACARSRPAGLQPAQAEGLTMYSQCMPSRPTPKPGALPHTALPSRPAPNTMMSAKSRPGTRGSDELKWPLPLPRAEGPRLHQGAALHPTVAPENLTLEGRRALRKLLLANKRLNAAYLLKEPFGQLWEYRSGVGARRFFERRRDALKWQRLKPYLRGRPIFDSPLFCVGILFS